MNYLLIRLGKYIEIEIHFLVVYFKQPTLKENLVNELIYGSRQKVRIILKLSSSCKVLFLIKNLKQMDTIVIRMIVIVRNFHV